MNNTAQQEKAKSWKSRIVDLCLQFGPITAVGAWAANALYTHPQLLGVFLLISATWVAHFAISRWLKIQPLGWVGTIIRLLKDAQYRQLSQRFGRTVKNPSFYTILVAAAAVVASLVLIANPKSVQRIMLNRFYGMKFIDQSKFKQHIEFLQNEKVREPLTKIPLIREGAEEYWLGDDGRGVDHYLANPNERLVFLVGNAGTGKSVIARQIAVEMYNSGKCDKVMYAELTRKTIGLLDEVTVPAILANEFSDSESNPFRISSDPDYFAHLCRVEKVLVVLDGLDELSVVKKGQRVDDTMIEIVIRAADEFRRATRATVLVATRPEALYKSRLTTTLESPALDIIRIQPLESQQTRAAVLEQYSKVMPSFESISAAHAEELKRKAIKLLNERPLLREMAVELEYLQVIMKKSEELSLMQHAHQQIEVLLEDRIVRNKKKHWKGSDWTDVEVTAAVKIIEKLAFEMLLSGSNYVADGASDIDILYCSGMCDLDSSPSHRFTIGPTPLCEYLALRHWRRLLKMPSDSGNDQFVLSDELARATFRFPEFAKPIVEWLRNDFSSSPQKYLDRIALIGKLLGRKPITDAIKNTNISAQELIEASIND